MERIVIGVDLSETSDAVARWACRLLADGGEAVLTHVIPGGRVGEQVDSEALERVESDTRDRLEALADALPCPASIRLATGRPAEALARMASDLDADLLAIGQGGGREPRLGATAERLVRLADRPVLVIHDAPDHDPRRLLLAVDASEAANDVIRIGRRLMEHFDAPATVLHVLDDDLLVMLRLAPEGSPERERSEKAIDSARDWLTGRVQDEGLPDEATSIATVFGSPVHEIARRSRGVGHAGAGADSEAEGHDLVVMGSRGLGGVRREIFGSVSSGVLRAAWGPVLIV